MQTQSIDFQRALADNNLRPFVVGEIVEGGASIYDDPLYTLQGVSGSMDLDETRAARRKFGSLKLIDKKGDLTPGNVGDLLHPNSGYEIRMRKGLNYRSFNLVPNAMAYPGLKGLGPWDMRGEGLADTQGNPWNGGRTSLSSITKSGYGSMVLSSPGGGTNVGVEALVNADWTKPPFVLSDGLPYAAVCWAFPIGVGLNVQFVLDVDSGVTHKVNVDLPANTWSPIVVPIQPYTSGSWAGVRGGASMWVQMNHRTGGAPLSPGDACCFDAFGLYADGNPDSTRPLKPQSEYNWLGFFRFDNEAVDDSGDTLSLTLGGLDRAFAFQQARWTGPFQIPRNTTIPEGIRRILADRWTGKHPIQLDATACAGHPIMHMTIPNAVFGADQTAADPWADCQTLAAVGGCELFPGPLGIVILRPFINPSLVDISASYIESWKPDPDLEPGTFALIPPIGREIDPAKLFSGIIVTGGNSQDRPCRAEVWDTDPASPTYVGKVGYIPAYYDSPLLRDTLQCFIAGRGLLSRIRLSSEVVTANIMPNPGHEGGDGVFLDRARAKATGIYVLSHLTMDLAPTGAMSITSRSTTDLGPRQASLS